VAVALIVAAAPSAPAAPTAVSGPVTGGNGIALASTLFDLGTVGYQESEFFVSGTATAYAPAGPFASDGRWAAAETGGADFTTRIVVRRPIDPRKFEGTVVVEWLNVSAQADLGVDWTMAHNEFVRRGVIWVGVSAQAVGVNALKNCCAARYGPLVHPTDSYSYDMFTQAGRVVRDQAATVLGGLSPKRLIAAGESQSAGRLVTYINAVHPLEHAYDAFLVHSRGAGGAPLSQTPLPAVSAPSPARIRDDLAEPVMVVQAEGDVIGSDLGARQPDTPRFRSWEMAGTSHADLYTSPVGASDIGDGQGAKSMFALMLDPPGAGACAFPTNAGAHHWILQSAFYRLDRWLRTGTPPPVGPLLTVASTGPTVVLARDAHGNALGGIRSPQVDVPVATLTGISSGPGFCRLFGSTVPFPPEKLAALYPRHGAFASAWRRATTAAVDAGFILGKDAGELRRAGTESTVGR
jgi:hypothetical protein